uniref:Uncharacterized protein n=2 Tax=Setaria viridis TaxID=4556 RepID=A0A4U6T3U8_SETVI|nr:hypothetical protein SEVIR_9G355100v2 [Setaria viridis]
MGAPSLTLSCHCQRRIKHLAYLVPAPYETSGSLFIAPPSLKSDLHTRIADRANPPFRFLCLAFSSTRRPPPPHASPTMANTVPQSGRAGGGRRWRAPTRGDLLTLLVAAMLCSASYCLGIWQNSRGAADSRVLGPSAAATVPTPSCGGGGGARAADANEPLEFEAHHAAESAGLSVSAVATRTTGARRALRGAGTAPASRAVARTGNPVPAGAEATAAGKSEH